MTNMMLAPGLTGRATFKIEPRHLASEVGSGDTHVLATPMLIAGMEEAAVNAVRDVLEPGMTTVGTHVNVYHKMASVLEMTVFFEARLEKISPDGKGLEFLLRAWDERGEIAEGRHERVIVDRDKFEQKAQARKQKS